MECRISMLLARFTNLGTRAQPCAAFLLHPLVKPIFTPSLTTRNQIGPHDIVISPPSSHPVKRPQPAVQLADTYPQRSRSEEVGPRDSGDTRLTVQEDRHAAQVGHLDPALGQRLHRIAAALCHRIDTVMSIVCLEHAALESGVSVTRAARCITAGDQT